MTREEAKHRLLNIERCTPIHTREDVRDFEALEMAIKALEIEPCEDAISRQATIEAFQMFRGYESNRTNAEWVDRIETIVKKLPPVNPQEPKWDRLYSWLNDMRLGIAPDETVTDIDERNARIAQTDILDEIMEWMLKQEPQESEG